MGFKNGENFERRFNKKPYFLKLDSKNDNLTEDNPFYAQNYILENWDFIVGPSYVEKSLPIKLQIEKIGGYLVIACDGSTSLEMEYLKEEKKNLRYELLGLMQILDRRGQAHQHISQTQ